MVLVVTFETNRVTEKEIKETLASKGVWLVFNEVYSRGVKVHFYIEHRFTDKIQDLFTNKVENLKFNKSRFQKKTKKGGYCSVLS